jgi:hypothetical protein
MRMHLGRKEVLREGTTLPSGFNLMNFLWRSCGFCKRKGMEGRMVRSKIGLLFTIYAILLRLSINTVYSIHGLAKYRIKNI